jgi:hypothetical protein
MVVARYEHGVTLTGLMSASIIGKSVEIDGCYDMIARIITLPLFS